MSRADLIEIIARGCCVGERIDPDDARGGWRHWTDAAEGVLAELADHGLAVVPSEATPKILANGWAAINEGRSRPVDMAPGPALREAWPAMVAAGDMARGDA